MFTFLTFPCLDGSMGMIYICWYKMPIGLIAKMHQECSGFAISSLNVVLFMYEEFWLWGISFFLLIGLS